MIIIDTNLKALMVEDKLHPRLEANLICFAEVKAKV